MVTEIRGVDGFGLNLKDFSKILGKKFACGNSLITDEATDEKVVQLLGDVDEDDLIDAIKDVRFSYFHQLLPINIYDKIPYYLSFMYQF